MNWMWDIKGSEDSGTEPGFLLEELGMWFSQNVMGAAGGVRTLSLRYILDIQVVCINLQLSVLRDIHLKVDGS